MYDTCTYYIPHCGKMHALRILGLIIGMDSSSLVDWIRSQHIPAYCQFDKMLFVSSFLLLGTLVQYAIDMILILFSVK